MKEVISLLTSSVGKKYLMAISGAGLFAFVIVHMLGNWLIFFGPDAINSYAFKLKSAPVLLWTARIGLLALAVIHVVCAVSLTIDNRRAKPTKYAVGKPVDTSWSSRTMALTGSILLTFIIFHILHFTTQHIDFSYRNLYAVYEGKKVHDVYNMVVKGFSNPIIAGFYMISVILLGAHLSHGVQSMFRSLGFHSKSIFPLVRKAAVVFGFAIALGMSSVPASVLLGLVKSRPDVKFSETQVSALLTKD